MVDNFKKIQKLHKASSVSITMTIFSVLILAILERKNPWWISIFAPALLLNFYSGRLDKAGIFFASILKNNTVLGFTEKAYPGTTLMEMLKAQGVLCEDVKCV